MACDLVVWVQLALSEASLLPHSIHTAWQHFPRFLYRAGEAEQGCGPSAGKRGNVNCHGLPDISQPVSKASQSAVGQMGQTAKLFPLQPGLAKGLLLVLLSSTKSSTGTWEPSWQHSLYCGPQSTPSQAHCCGVLAHRPLLPL